MWDEITYPFPISNWLNLWSLILYIYVTLVINEWAHCINNCDPFHKHGLTLIPAWISNYMHYKMWDEILLILSLNFNGFTVEVCEWISNFFPHDTMHVITYPCKRGHINLTGTWRFNSSIAIIHASVNRGISDLDNILSSVRHQAIT